MTTGKLVRLGKKGQLVIPKEMREALGVKDGDELLACLENGRVVLARPSDYGRATRGLLRGTWGGGKQAVKRYLERERGSWQ